MRNIAVFFVAFSIFAGSVYARLGENLEQLATRYGNPREESEALIRFDDRSVPVGKCYTYAEKNYEVMCDVIDGTCLRIIFFKKTKWARKDFTTILEANAPGAKWTETSTGSERAKDLLRTWTNSDGGRATFFGESLAVFSPAFVTLYKKLESEAQPGAPAKP